MATRSFTVQLEDEEDVEVEVEFDVDSWGSPGVLSGPPEFCEPPESPEITILTAIRDDDGADILDFLPEKERERIETEILENIADYDDDGPDYEPDYDD